MSRKTMTQSSDSQESNPLSIQPRQERKYTITPLGHKWLAWDKRQENLKEQPGEFINQAEQRRGIDTSWMDEI